LSPPEGLEVGSSQTGVFRFRSTVDNDEFEFLGFEVYYKIYDATQGLPPPYYENRDNLVADAYHRLNNPTVDTPPANQNAPLIFVDPADRGVVFDVAISFQVGEDVYPQLTTEASGPETTTQINALRRSVFRSTPNEFKRFTEFVQDDVGASNTDVTQAVFDAISDTQAVNINCFAVSFGNDDGLIVYSQPEWLGYQSITIPYP